MALADAVLEIADQITEMARQLEQTDAAGKFVAMRLSGFVGQLRVAVKAASGERQVITAADTGVLPAGLVFPVGDAADRLTAQLREREQKAAEAKAALRAAAEAEERGSATVFCEGGPLDGISVQVNPPPPPEGAYASLPSRQAPLGVYFVKGSTATYAADASAQLKGSR